MVIRSSSGNTSSESRRYKSRCFVKASGIEVAHLSDIGRKRKHNEDAFGFFSLSEDEVLAIVADGMGGHTSGEIASRMAVEIIREIYSKERGDKDVLAALKSAFQVA